MSLQGVASLSTPATISVRCAGGVLRFTGLSENNVLTALKVGAIPLSSRSRRLGSVFGVGEEGLDGFAGLGVLDGDSLEEVLGVAAWDGEEGQEEVAGGGLGVVAIGGFLNGALDDGLCGGGVLDAVGGGAAAGFAGEGFELRQDAREVGAKPVEGAGGSAVAFADQSQQEMLGIDLRVVVPARGELGLEQRFARQAAQTIRPQRPRCLERGG